ncbi:MAG TPA: VanZ family protein [Burkholderiales bacterium]|nr:VanZ family protein [Burkholderiales bacterium]
MAFAVYVLLVVYASLYPLEGWHDHGLSPFAYLSSPWPRYVMTLDVALNILGYMPYGFLCVAALYPRTPALAAFGIAVASAALLSLSLEAAQSYLPTRVAANLDVLCNLAGAACGAALAVLAVPALLGGPLQRLRSAAFLDGTDIDFGLALLALWLFTQLNPATLLFAAGDLREWLAPGMGRARAPQFFVGIEAFIAAANLVSVGLLLSALARPGRPGRTMFLALVLAAIGVKTAAFAILLHAENVLVWLTPGARYGLAAGILLALAALAMPRVARLATAAVLLMAATVLVNLAPPNPYLAASLKLWQQGHFLNFNGVTRLVSALWAYVALGYLMLLAARRREPVG